MDGDILIWPKTSSDYSFFFKWVIEYVSVLYKLVHSHYVKEWIQWLLLLLLLSDFVLLYWCLLNCVCYISYQLCCFVQVISMSFITVIFVLLIPRFEIGQGIPFGGKRHFWVRCFSIVQLVVNPSKSDLIQEVLVE